MRNLSSLIGLLAVFMELLCSRFRMSWNRCASVSIGVLDGACMLTTSMPCSSLSPGTLYIFFEIRPVPCSVAAYDVEADRAGNIALLVE